MRQSPDSSRNRSMNTPTSQHVGDQLWSSENLWVKLCLIPIENLRNWRGGISPTRFFHNFQHLRWCRTQVGGWITEATFLGKVSAWCRTTTATSNTNTTGSKHDSNHGCCDFKLSSESSWDALSDSIWSFWQYFLRTHVTHLGSPGFSTSQQSPYHVSGGRVVQIKGNHGIKVTWLRGLGKYPMIHDDKSTFYVCIYIYI